MLPEIFAPKKVLLMLVLEAVGIEKVNGVGVALVEGVDPKLIDAKGFFGFEDDVVGVALLSFVVALFFIVDDSSLPAAIALISGALDPEDPNDVLFRFACVVATGELNGVGVCIGVFDDALTSFSDNDNAKLLDIIVSNLEAPSSADGSVCSLTTLSSCPPPPLFVFFADACCCFSRSACC